jgi:hypothetical protein
MSKMDFSFMSEILLAIVRVSFFFFAINHSSFRICLWWVKTPILQFVTLPVSEVVKRAVQLTPAYLPGNFARSTKFDHQDKSFGLASDRL